MISENWLAESRRNCITGELARGKITQIPGSVSSQNIAVVWFVFISNLLCMWSLYKRTTSGLMWRNKCLILCKIHTGRLYDTGSDYRAPVWRMWLCACVCVRASASVFCVYVCARIQIGIPFWSTLSEGTDLRPGESASSLISFSFLLISASSPFPLFFPSTVFNAHINTNRALDVGKR